ncbi:MAG: hypothetical protein K6E16_09015 [Lachnospiraceae bacterium]|nr:hypothetical protein [Lachnospiraceae bacterium]
MANFWEKIKEKLGFGGHEDDEIDFALGLSEGKESASMDSVLSRETVRRSDLNVLDYRDRERYVRACCEQMTAASREVDVQKVEYQTVTERLTDLEEIAQLPVSDREEIKKRAMKILQIEEDETHYRRPVSKITEVQYREMERQEDEIPEILKTMQEREDYQMTVRRDLNLLEGEKSALAFQCKEDAKKAKNTKGYIVIILVTAVLAFALLVFLQKAIRMDVTVAYYVLTGLTAIAVTACGVSYRSAQGDQTKAEKQINRAISLQNSAKIKYVNITNLLDFMYSKYQVRNSYELSYMWDKYKEEKEARNHSEEVAQKLEEARRSLYALLSHFRLKDASIWVYQPGALVYEEEMTELRHSLIIQRQRLRKGIDFNLFNLEDSKKEIEQLVKDYPKYAREILAIVTQYE